MFLNGHLFIQGENSYAVRLLEGIREFEQILLSDKTFGMNDQEIITKIVGMLSEDGKVHVLTDRKEGSIHASLLMIGLTLLKEEKDEAGKGYVIYGRHKGFGNFRHLRAIVYPRIGVRSNASTLALDIEDTSIIKEILSANYKDKGTRSFVVTSSNPAIMPGIMTQLAIYEANMNRIVLDKEAEKESVA